MTRLQISGIRACMIFKGYSLSSYKLTNYFSILHPQTDFQLDCSYEQKLQEKRRMYYEALFRSRSWGK